MPREEIVGRKLSQLYRLDKVSQDPERENVMTMRTKTASVRCSWIRRSWVDAVEPQTITTYVDITELERVEQLRLSDARIQRLRSLITHRTAQASI